MKAKRLFIDIKLLVAIFCCVALLCTSPIYAQANTGGKAWIGSTEYPTMEDAIKAAQPGDTITLGEGRYSLYEDYGKAQNKNTPLGIKGKNLTFVGKGTDKTFWGIGATVPDPSKFGTEFNGDYSFDGIDTVTFKNMTLQSGKVQYLGFIRADNTVVEDCVINGLTYYWGYKTALFKNTTFNAPKGFFGGNYAIYTYSSPVMTFDGCTFNSSGKTINAFSDYTAEKNDITINYRNCTVNSSKSAKTIININDSNKGDKKFYINISGKNIINGKVYRDTRKPKDTNHTSTCSRLFGFGGKQDDNNTGRTVVTIDGIKVFENGARVSHEIDTPNDKYTDGYKDNAYDRTPWVLTADGTQYQCDVVCKYCGDKHSAKGYKLTYNPNYGTWSDGKSSNFEEEIVNVKTPLVIKEAPTRPGFVFAKWENGKEYVPGQKYAGKNAANEFVNGTLTAQWVTSKNSKYPQTGDSSNVAIWSMLLIVSVAIIGFVFKKKRYAANK